MARGPCALCMPCIILASMEKLAVLRLTDAFLGM